MRYIILMALVLLMVSCGGEEQDNGCTEVYEYTADVVSSKDVSDQFYCEEMEDIFGQNGKEYIQAWQKIEFVAIDREPEMPETVGFGKLKSCSLAKVDDYSDCLGNSKFVFEEKSDSSKEVLVNIFTVDSVGDAGYFFEIVITGTDFQMIFGGQSNEECEINGCREDCYCATYKGHGYRYEMVKE